jgi:hypothetical protein
MTIINLIQKLLEILDEEGNLPVYAVVPGWQDSIQTDDLEVEVRDAEFSDPKRVVIRES